MVELVKISGDLFKDISEISVLFSFLVTLVLLLIGVVVFFYFRIEKLNKDQKDEIINHEKEYQEEYNKIRNLYETKIDDLSKENLKKYEEMNRQWVESEKETLNVLNGVSSILEMSEKMSKVDTDRILEKINNTEQRILDLINNIDKNSK